MKLSNVICGRQNYILHLYASVNMLKHFTLEDTDIQAEDKLLTYKLKLYTM